jgi:hypothetical protein
MRWTIVIALVELLLELSQIAPAEKDIYEDILGLPCVRPIVCDRQDCERRTGCHDGKAFLSRTRRSHDGSLVYHRQHSRE